MNLSPLVELLVRSGALLIAGESIRRLSRAQSAAFRHKLLLWVFALLALLPVMAAIFPEIPITSPTPSHQSKAVVTVLEISSRPASGAAGHPFNWLFGLWIAGVVIACAPLVTGAISVWRIGRRASRHSLIGGIEVLVTAELQMPITYGVIRRRVLLPIHAESWSEARLRAVLLHELAHVRRRDVAAQMGAHLIAAVWWFQPLVWLLRRSLRVESEFACDAEAIGSGFKPSDYASELLAVARSVDTHWKLPGSAIAMVRSTNLEDRVRAVLNCRNVLLRPRMTYAIGLVLGVAAIGSSTVTVRPNRNLSESGGSTMKRSILSALLTSAGLSAATVSGVVHDSSGVPVADANVTIYNPDTSAKQDAITDGDGKFSLNGSGAGQYILRIEKAGLVSIFREFDLKAESEMDREFTMSLEGAPTVADKVVSGENGSPKKIRVGGSVAEANLLNRVIPMYPAAAKTSGARGTVEIEATISKDGIPTELRVLSSPSDDLSKSSLEAVRQWRYRATLLNENPVTIITMVIVNYILKQ